MKIHTMIILAYSLDHKGPFIYDGSHLGGRGGGVKPPLMKGSCTFRAHTRNEMPLHLRFNICKGSCTFRSQTRNEMLLINTR